jgi:membrane-bound ClpP family serine protease
MEWLTVISLVVIGITLVIVEFIFIPGTTIVGIFGIIAIMAGIVLSFQYFGNPIGWYTLGGTGVLCGVMFYYAFRTRAWERFSLKSTVEGRVNEVDTDTLKAGEEGQAVSALRPMGKAELGGKMVEVTTLGNYVDSGTRIRIIRISTNQIVVEPVL